MRVSRQPSPRAGCRRRVTLESRSRDNFVTTRPIETHVTVAVPPRLRPGSDAPEGA
jgi:hypothetical protein